MDILSREQTETDSLDKVSSANHSPTPVVPMVHNLYPAVTIVHCIEPSLRPSSTASPFEVSQPKPSHLLTFTQNLLPKIAPGNVNNKWAVVYLLKIISKDKKKENIIGYCLVAQLVFSNSESSKDSKDFPSRAGQYKGWNSLQMGNYFEW